MGVFITCKWCKAKEKSKHPTCNCIQNEYQRLIKMIEGSTVIKCIVNENMMYIHYNKLSLDFYIQINQTNQYCPQYIEEITSDTFTAVLF